MEGGRRRVKRQIHPSLKLVASVEGLLARQCCSQSFWNVDTELTISSCPSDSLCTCRLGISSTLSPKTHLPSLHPLSSLSQTQAHLYYVLLPDFLLKN